MTKPEVSLYSSTDSAKNTDCSSSSVNSNLLLYKPNKSKLSSSRSFSGVGETLTSLQRNDNVQGKLFLANKDDAHTVVVPFKDYLQTMIERRFENLASAKDLSEEERAQREGVLDWMFAIGKNLSLTSLTIHKAATYFNRILEHNFLKRNELKDVALVCLLIAGKYLETQREIENLLIFFKEKVGHLKDISKYEMQIMGHLNWDFRCVTPIEFIDIFKSQGVLFCSDNISSLIAAEPLSERLDNILDYVGSSCLKEYELVKTDPLVLAAGILAVARKLLGLKNMWNEPLELLTSVEKGEAEKCARLILKYCKKSLPHVQAEDEFDEGNRAVTIPMSYCICTMRSINAKHANRANTRIAAFNNH
eukprot:TRINITY_DN12695_c0_g2_i1.p1 TRINITY_DN12695_c0_g2~~TRINITY_DN12695_c0_g2_i1.p1  ORF type:complete len:363 (+),score=49.54 TRINITY_DN12695_c0_g2_i1:125-1213(+)